MSMNRRILNLAIPSIIANITTPLLGLVDAAVTGHMGSAIYLAAIAVGGIMFNILYWFFGFLRGGTSGLSAQAYGAKDDRASTLVLYRSLLIGVTAGFSLIALQWPIAEGLTWFLKPDPETTLLARRYFSILIWGAPAMLATYALSGWFLGMQNSRMIMWTSMIINVVNISVSLLLVYGFGMKIEGVAAGTLIAQYSGLVAALLFLRGYRRVSVKLPEVLRGGEVKRFFSVNIFLMLRTLCMIAVTLWFTRAGAVQGAVILAVNTLLIQLFMLFSYMMDGFAFAGEALAGRYTGANDDKSLRRCITLLFRWGFAMATIFTAVYFLGGEAFLGLLTSDSGIIVASKDYWTWAVTVPFASFAGFVWDGVYIGTTLTRGLLVTMLFSMAVFFIVELTLYPLMGNHALWLAFVLYLLSRGISQYIFFRSHRPL